MLESQNEPDEATVFSSQVRAARGLLGWSQSELARRAKISVAAIARIELGTTDCRMSTIQALKHTFMLSGIEFHNGADGRFGVLQSRPANGKALPNGANLNATPLEGTKRDATDQKLVL